MCRHSGFPTPDPAGPSSLLEAQGRARLRRDHSPHDLPSNWIIYFSSCCVRSRVKGEHFPLPPNSLNHSLCSTEDLESPSGSEHPVTGFDELYCPERGRVAPAPGQDNCCPWLPRGSAGTGGGGSRTPEAAPHPRGEQSGREKPTLAPYGILN